MKTPPSAPANETGAAGVVLREAAASFRHDYLHYDHLELLDSSEDDLEFVMRMPSATLSRPQGRDPDFTAEPDWGWQIVDDSAFAMTPLLMWVSESRLESVAYVATTAMLESARTTAMAIGLLIRRGFLADAEARWRGLYELAAQIALFAHGGFEPEADVEALARAYLADNEQLSGLPAPEGVTIYDGKDYGWLQFAGGKWALAKPSSRISQSKVFTAARLTELPDQELHHGAVHMSNRVAVAGGTANGDAPAGATIERARDLTVKVLIALNDIVANVAFLVTRLTGSDYPEILRAAHEFDVSVHEWVRPLSPLD